MVEILCLKLSYFASPEEFPEKENNGRLPGWGYRVGMPDEEAFRLNRWDWNIGPNRHPEFVIFAYGQCIRLAATISSIEDIPASPTGKKEIRGSVLSDGHPVYDRFVNKPPPAWARGRGNRYALIDL
jgi:hypothetical protein